MSERTPVRVIFREHQGEVAAVFDDRSEFPRLMTYVHNGQHGTGEYEWYRVTNSAKPEQYADLLKELTAIGYDVTVGKRLSNYWKA